MKNIFLVFAILVMLAVSCVPISDRGEEGKACFKNGTCLEGLVCDKERNICVKEELFDGGVKDVGHRDTGITDISGEEIRDYGVDIGDVVEDVEEIKDYVVDGGVEIEDVEDIGDNMVVDVGDVSVDIEDVGEDTQDVADTVVDVEDISVDIGEVAEDVSDAGLDVSDVSDISDVSDTTPIWLEVYDLNMQYPGTESYDYPPSPSCLYYSVTGKIHCVGGGWSQALQDHKILDIKTMQWSDGPAMPTGTYHHSVIEFDGVLWAIGGYTGYAGTDAVRYFDGSSWNTANSLSWPANGVATTISSDGKRLIACGGHNNYCQLYSNCAYIENKSGNWISMTPLPDPPRTGGVFINVNNNVCYAGGANFDGKCLTAEQANDIYCYNEGNSKWDHIDDIPVDLSGPADENMFYIPIDNTKYILGKSLEPAISYLKDIQSGIWSKIDIKLISTNKKLYFIRSGLLVKTGDYEYIAPVGLYDGIDTRKGYSAKVIVCPYHPDCTNHTCAKDECGGKCGGCGDNAKCVNLKCVCNDGYIDCDGERNNGCERQASDPKHIWSKSFGGSGSDSWIYSSSVDNSGNVYILGSFSSSSINFGGGTLNNAGGNDIFLAKFDSNGNHLWSKRFGGSNEDYGMSVSTDNLGNVYITGYFRSSTIEFGGGVLTNTNAGTDEIFLAKFDSDGKHLWSKSFGGSNHDDGASVAVDNSGNVYITGSFRSSTIDLGGGALNNAGSGAMDIFLAKFDSNGNHIWSKRFGVSVDDWAQSISVDSSGNLFIAGMFKGSNLNFGGGSITNNGGLDFFLAKFDSNGNHQWSKGFGGNNDDYSYSVSADSSGNVYITGFFKSSTIDFGGGALNNAGGWDTYLAKFDSNGSLQWSKRFGGNADDWGYYVSAASSGDVYITGWYSSSDINFGGNSLTNGGGRDIFLARFGSNGNHIWSKSFGGNSYDEGRSVSVDSSGNVYGTGYFQGSNIDFGGCPLSSAGNADIYLIKYAP